MTTQNMNITIDYQTKKTINRCANILGTTANELISDILDDGLPALETFAQFALVDKWHKDAGSQMLTPEEYQKVFLDRFEDFKSKESN